MCSTILRFLNIVCDTKTFLRLEMNTLSFLKPLKFFEVQIIKVPEEAIDVGSVKLSKLV